MSNERRRLLYLRVRALANVRTGYEPHQEAIQWLSELGISKVGLHERRINGLAWRYRRQISAELWPVRDGLGEWLDGLTILP